VHLVGIGGAGMSGLALAMQLAGLRVSGSDRSPSEALARLRSAGVTIWVGHGADRLPPDAALVIASPAVPGDNPELIAAAERGIPIVKRAHMLGALTRLPGLIAVCVAGTHGKSTISGWVAFVLSAAGSDPSYFVGADLPDLGANARLGSGWNLVVEADEYDRTFLHLRPDVAVISNVDHDHIDVYPSASDVEAAFGEFAASVPGDGRIVAGQPSPALERVLERSEAPIDTCYVEGFATPPGDSGRRRGQSGGRSGAARGTTWLARDVAVHGDSTAFDVERDGVCLGTFTIRPPGLHNVSNALLALAALEAVGVPPEAAREPLASFRGAGRRFEVAGRAAGVTVVDDYAHHPAEIAATIAAGRQRSSGGRLWAVLQPHTHSRVAAMAEGFARALEGADRQIIAPVFAAREAPMPGGDAAAIAAHLRSATLADDLIAAAHLVADGATAGDTALFLGAGDIQRGSRACLVRLRRRQADELVARARQSGLGGVLVDPPTLADWTSLRVGGPADVLVRAEDVETMAAWLSLAWDVGVPARVLGRGSNVLVDDAGVVGLVALNRCEGYTIEPSRDGRTAIVTAESGITLAALGQHLARAGWSGLEAAVGIPGSIGAAVVTNAGAHGWEMSDSLIDAELLAPDGRRVVDANALAFRYRGSSLKGRPEEIVLRARLNVVVDSEQAIRERMRGFTALRRATQPTGPSVGSMFKNPPGNHAGRLIEAVGLKGHREGGATISAVHANFFVNDSGAKAEDVQRLVALARERVRERFGIELELEIEPLGASGPVAGRSTEIGAHDEGKGVTDAA